MDMQEVRRANLADWVKQHGGHTAAARIAGLKPSEAAYLSACINGYSLGEKSARNWERKLGIDAFTLDKATALAESTPAYAGGIAHKMSLPTETVAPTVPWEQLKMEPRQLPAEFYVVLPDDSMAPVAPAGTKVKFDTRLKAMPGDAVLVAGPQGEPFFREMRALLGGAWEAHPSNKAYPVLHSEQHGLVVLGVFVGLDRPWSALAR